MFKPSALTSLLVLLLLAPLGAATCQSNVPSEPPTEAARRPLVGAGDVLDVRVYGEDELSGVHRVGQEGSIRLPLVGTLAVDGLTADEIAERIEAAYNARYLRDAQVNVHVKEFNSRKVFILGEVKNPGSYPYEEQMTVIGVIARAGGTSRLADLNRTLVTREQEGKTIRLTIEVNEIRKGQAPDVELLPGDIVFIPETLF